MNYLRDKKKVIRQFKEQLLDIYDGKSENLITCFRMYLGFLRKFADAELTEFEQFQLDDMEMSIYNPAINTFLIALETAWLYTRRGGKTRGLAILAPFFSLLDKDVAWRAPHGEQLKKAGYWYSLNPFTEKVMIRTENVIRIVNSPDISIAPMTVGRVAGGDCDVLILDEGGWIMKHLQAYLMYLTCRPMVSTSKFKHIINASTPARDTAFEDEWNFIQKSEDENNLTLSSLHDCEDCHWITPEWIAAESKKYPKWYIELNYYCKWTVPYGAVFEKVYDVNDYNSPITKETLWSMIPTHAGVDHNGGDKAHPHYIVTGTFDDNFLYILDEYKFTDLNFLFDPKFRHYSFEIEDGLFNTQWTDQEKSMGFDALYFGWNKEDKMKRVQEVRNRITIIDKTRCPDTYRNFMNAGFNPKSRLMELEKRTDQHGLDCVLHLMHPSSANMQIYGRTAHAPIEKRFGDTTRQLRI